MLIICEVTKTISQLLIELAFWFISSNVLRIIIIIFHTVDDVTKQKKVNRMIVVKEWNALEVATLLHVIITDWNVQLIRRRFRNSMET